MMPSEDSAPSPPSTAETTTFSLPEGCADGAKAPKAAVEQWRKDRRKTIQHLKELGIWGELQPQWWGARKRYGEKAGWEFFVSRIRPQVKAAEEQVRKLGGAKYVPEKYRGSNAHGRARVRELSLLASRVPCNLNTPNSLCVRWALNHLFVPVWDMDVSAIPTRFAVNLLILCASSPKFHNDFAMLSVRQAMKIGKHDEPISAAGDTLTAIARMLDDDSPEGIAGESEISG